MWKSRTRAASISLPVQGRRCSVPHQGAEIGKRRASRPGTRVWGLAESIFGLALHLPVPSLESSQRPQPSQCFTALAWGLPHLTAFSAISHALCTNPASVNLPHTVYCTVSCGLKVLICLHLSVGPLATPQSSASLASWSCSLFLEHGLSVFPAVSVCWVLASGDLRTDLCSVRIPGAGGPS